MKKHVSTNTEIWYEVRYTDGFGKQNSERFGFLGGARARRKEIYRGSVACPPEIWSVQTGPGNARVETRL